MRHRRIRGSKGNGGSGKKRIVRIVAVFWLWYLPAQLWQDGQPLH